MTFEDTTIKKPPLGARPAYITIEARIRELGEAISRYDSLTQTTDQIRSWAKEILIYCATSDVIKSMTKNKEEKKNE